MLNRFYFPSKLDVLIFFNLAYNLDALKYTGCFIQKSLGAIERISKNTIYLDFGMIFRKMF